MATDNISKLRQIGQAASLYEQGHGEYPMRTAELASEGLIPTELCASNEDDVPHGTANAYVRARQSRYALGGTVVKETPYKSSFVGAGEMGYKATVFRKMFEGSPGAGWLVDFTETKKGSLPLPDMGEGRYRRLLLDGAVVSRVLKDIDCDGSPCRQTSMLFTDVSFGSK